MDLIRKTSMRKVVDCTNFHKFDILLVNQQNGRMKTTLDLPSDLLMEIKLRALQNGLKFKEAVAILLRKGLEVPTERRIKNSNSLLGTDPETGLPLIRADLDAPAARMSTEEIYAMIHQSQEEEDLEHLGLSVRR